MTLAFPFQPPLNTLHPDPMIKGMPQWRWDGDKWKKLPGMAPGAIGDAPHNGKTYGRKNEDWNEALSGTGGVLTGPLDVQSTVTASSNITSPAFRTMLGGNTEFAFHRSGNYLYVDFNDGAGWRLLATEHRIWDVCRWLMTNENPGANSVANAMRLPSAGTHEYPQFMCPVGAAAGANIWNAYYSGYKTCRYIQYHIPSQGWILAQFAN